jgi:hypothetical protein
VLSICLAYSAPSGLILMQEGSSNSACDRQNNDNQKYKTQ